ncbi:MAG: Asp-tRNA(Asn)/Glu-tRNA(Gln) amidotransferase subunit GatC [Bdellovibrionota bacterium]
MDKKEVEKIGRLSRLKLTSEEVDFYTNHLSMILGHFEELSSIKTEGIEPLVTPTTHTPHTAKDEVKRVVTTEEILKNAPERSGNLFKVPPVVGGD